MKQIFTFLAIQLAFGINAQTVSWLDPIGAPIKAIVSDVNGNIFATGSFSGTVDFDPGLGVIEKTANGYLDGYVAKYAPDGTFLWVRQFWANSDAALSATAISVAPDGNIVFGGNFAGLVDFMPEHGGVPITSTGSDGFVCGLNNSGDYLWLDHWATYGEFFVTSLCSDISGNIGVIGKFTSNVDFDPGDAVYNLSAIGTGSAYVLKLLPGGTLAWIIPFNSGPIVTVNSIANDDNGSFYIAGSTSDSLTLGSVQINTPSGISLDAILMKIDGNGDAQWGIAIGGSMVDVFSAVDVNSAGEIAVTGTIAGNFDLDPGTGFINAYCNNQDAVLMKFNTDGSLAFGVKCNGTSGFGDYNSGNAVAIAENGDCYFTGDFIGSLDADFGAGYATLQYVNAGQDAFICKYSSVGGFIWAGSITGDGYSVGNSLAIAPNNDLYMSGAMSNSNAFNIGTFQEYINLGPVNSALLKISSLATQLEYVNSDNIFELSPNPSNNLLNIQLNTKDETAEIRITSLLGQTLQTSMCNSSVQISTADLPSGIYIVVCNHKGTQSQRKLIVAH